MKKIKTAVPVVLLLLPLLLLLYSCHPVRLTASWNDRNVPPATFKKILVLSIGNDLAKRRLAEDYIKAALIKHGLNAEGSIETFGPGFTKDQDSLKIRRVLLDNQFDGVLTVRKLDVNEHDRWMPGAVYYGPVGFYRGFYGYYYRTWGYYAEPGYMVTEVEVLLESNLYQVQSGRLLWSGQSKALSRNPTPDMAARYARNVVEDIIGKGVIAH